MKVKELYELLTAYMEHDLGDEEIQFSLHHKKSGFHAKLQKEIAIGYNMEWDKSDNPNSVREYGLNITVYPREDIDPNEELRNNMKKILETQLGQLISEPDYGKLLAEFEGEENE